MQTNSETQNKKRKGKNIMKTTKRILTLALALVMIVAMAIPALADTIETGISVTGTGTTSYKVYKIFDIEPVANGNKYQLTEDWADFTAPGYFTVTENDYAVWDKDTVSVADAAAIAQLAKNYVEQKGLTTQTTVAVGQQIETEAGYFLLVPENGPCGVVLVEQGSVTTVEEKSTATGQPVVEKRVKEDSLDQYVTANTADIGQILDYQIVITAGENAENYILHDKMDSHIVPTTNSMKVIRDGNELTRDTDFEVIMNPGDDCGCTFHVKFSENICKSLHDDAKLVVTYTGVLTEEADADHEHKNTTWLTHTAANAPSNESSVVTETNKIIVKKKTCV